MGKLWIKEKLTMKKLLLTAILIAAASLIGGCSFVYEEHRCHRRPRVIVGPPVVEVIPVPPHHPRHHRPRWRRY